MEFLKTNCIVFGSVRLREVKCLSRILDLSEQGQLLSLKPVSHKLLLSEWQLCFQ